MKLWNLQVISDKIENKNSDTNRNLSENEE